MVFKNFITLSIPLHCMNDIFSRIIAGEIPCTKVYEDDKTLAFLDINPKNKGHTLVVPKKKAVSVEELDPAYAAALMHTIQKVSKAIKKAYGEHYNILANNGRHAGQVVDYVHFHIIPRHENDGFHFSADYKRYAPGEDEKVAEKIKANL